MLVSEDRNLASSRLLRVTLVFLYKIFAMKMRILLSLERYRQKKNLCVNFISRIFIILLFISSARSN